MHSPLLISVVNDYELVVKGAAAMLAPFTDRVRVVDLQVAGLPERRIDIALFDTFGTQEESVLERCRSMQSDGVAGRIVLYTWQLTPGTRQRAVTSGVDGIIMKTEPADKLVDALEAVADGHRVGLDAPADHSTGLTTREREILELMAVGRTNFEIARALFVSEETVKTYAKRLFRKLGVRNRVEAAVRAAELGVVA